MSERRRLRGNPNPELCAPSCPFRELGTRCLWVTESVQRTSTCIAGPERLRELGILWLQNNSATNANVYLLPSRKVSGFFLRNGVKMPKEAHTKAAECHEDAAKVHRT
jgi:hypothetical protein